MTFWDPRGAQLDQPMRMVMRRFVGQNWILNDGTLDLESLNRLATDGYVECSEVESPLENTPLPFQWILTSKGQYLFDFLVKTGGFEDQVPDHSGQWLARR